MNAGIIKGLDPSNMVVSQLATLGTAVNFTANGNSV